MSKHSCKPQIQIFHENEFGFIGKCPCCKEIQFGIGNLVSYMAFDDFMVFYQSFKRIEEKLNLNQTKLTSANKIMLRTPVENILLSFSQTEFNQVIELFDQAVFKLQLLNPLEETEKMN